MQKGLLLKLPFHIYRKGDISTFIDCEMYFVIIAVEKGYRVSLILTTAYYAYVCKCQFNLQKKNSGN